MYALARLDSQDQFFEEGNGVARRCADPGGLIRPGVPYPHWVGTSSQCRMRRAHTARNLFGSGLSLRGLRRILEGFRSPTRRELLWLLTYKQSREWTVLDFAVVHTRALDDTLFEGYPFSDDRAPFGWRVEHVQPPCLLEQDRRRRVLTFVKRDRLEVHRACEGASLLSPRMCVNVLSVTWPPLSRARRACLAVDRARPS